MRYIKLLTPTLVLLLTPCVSWAVDYKDWLPLIPDTLDGLTVSAKDEGENLDLGVMNMSNFSRQYGEGDKQINISIMYESSGEQIKAQNARTQKNIKLAELVQKRITIQGFESVYDHNKSVPYQRITVFLNDKAVISFGVFGLNEEKHFFELANKINFRKINDTF